MSALAWIFGVLCALAGLALIVSIILHAIDTHREDQ